MADEQLPDFLRFQRQNPQDWKKLLDAIFPNGLPLRASWHEPTAIYPILNQLGAARNVHYFFLPSGGSLELQSAQANGDTGLSELQLGSGAWIGKVANLSFESFGDKAHYLWCYFRLELEELPARRESPTNREDYYQYLTEVRPGEYLPTSAWDNRDEEGYDLGPQARLIVRALKGSFVLFAKFSPYERLSHATDAPHEGLSRDAFRERVQLLHDVAEANPSTTTMDYLDKLLVNGDPLTTNVIR